MADGEPGGVSEPAYEMEMPMMDATTRKAVSLRKFNKFFLIFVFISYFSFY